MTRSARLDVNGNGYEQIRAADGSCLSHHRVLLFAWGELNSVFFHRDAREVHHIPVANGKAIEWLNTERQIEALTPAEHRERDPGRAQIRAPWDDLDWRGSA